MPITRTPMVDDNGSGTTGTILNNAWKQELYDQIDAFSSPGAFIDANILPSTIHNWFPPGFGKLDTVINVNAGSVACLITGLVAGNPGQRVVIRNLSADPTTVISIGHANAGSTAANQFQCFATSAPYPIGLRGSVELVYSGSNWLMVNAAPGAWITPLFNASDYAIGAGTGSWTLTAGNINNCAYCVHGRTLSWTLGVNGTSIAGAPVGLTRKLFGNFTATTNAAQWIGSLGGVHTVGLYTVAPTIVTFFRDYLGTVWPAGPLGFKTAGSYEIV
jgi:hypothetical protein